jgi:hypothetical protein
MSCLETFLGGRRGGGRGATSPESVNEELKKASDLLFGADECTGESVSDKENAFRHINVSCFEGLGLDKQEYIYWLSNPAAREQLLTFSKRSYNNENLEFIIAGVLLCEKRAQASPPLTYSAILKN